MKNTKFTLSDFGQAQFITTCIFWKSFWKNVNPKSCYRAFVPTNFVKLNTYVHTFFITKNIIYNLEIIISKTLYQNLSFKVLKELSCSCNVQSFERDKCGFFFTLLVRRLEFNDTGFFSFVNRKEVRHAYNGRRRPCIFLLNMP
jgi:hypothetical protein